MNGSDGLKFEGKGGARVLLFGESWLVVVLEPFICVVFSFGFGSRRFQGASFGAMDDVVRS